MGMSAQFLLTSLSCQKQLHHVEVANSRNSSLIASETKIPVRAMSQILLRLTLGRLNTRSRSRANYRERQLWQLLLQDTVVLPTMVSEYLAHIILGALLAKFLKK